MTDAPAPDACTTMADVRAAVDAIDLEIGALIAARFGYMRAAARIKPERHMVRDDDRKDQVIANAAAHAALLGYPPEAAAATWGALVEASIAYELEVFDAASRPG